jgi:hypothetical protein
MENIIYSSPHILPWDTQSAFKVNDYHVGIENDMVYAYIKCQVAEGNLRVNCYQFILNPAGKKSLSLAVKIGKVKICTVFGYDGISKVTLNGKETINYTEKDISFSAEKHSDEQGAYWRGEIILGKGFIKKTFEAEIKEGMKIFLAFSQILPTGNANLLSDEKYENGEDSMFGLTVLNF